MTLTNPENLHWSIDRKAGSSQAPNHDLFTHREEINTRAHTHAQTERRGEAETDKREDGERKRDQGWIFRE